MMITSASRYLLLPVSRSVARTKVRLFEKEQLLLDLDASICFEAPESVLYYDLTPWMGKDLTVCHESNKSFGFSANRPAAPQELCRPQIHFTAEYGWINDPNGLIFYEGAYHLFFQHNPVGVCWGNMHWGHARSHDLVHWEELGDVLFPDSIGDMYSGCALVDHQNLLGMNTPEHEALLLFYTACGNNREISAGKACTQCLAVSTDGAQTFRKYEKNPIISNLVGGNRDPKVLFDDATGCYLMALYLNADRYGVLTSPDLIHWQQIQTFSLQGDNECPDIFPMVDEKGARKWVFGGAHDFYTVCDFDQERGFVNFSPEKRLGFGKCYAAQSFCETGARRLRFSWNHFSIPSPYFNCAMSVPCELILRGEELLLAPAHELDAVWSHTETHTSITAQGFHRTINAPLELSLKASRLKEALQIELCGNLLIADIAAGILTIGDETMPLYAQNETLSLRILADRFGIEIFTGVCEDCDCEGYARAYGAFNATMTGDALTFTGNAFLKELTLRTL